MDRTKSITCLIALGLISLSACSRSKTEHVLRVGSKNFTEQVVLGEIIAQHLENRLHRKVERSLNLGGTLLAHEALLKGEIDVYPEYTGTGLAAVLKDSSNPAPDAVLQRVRSEYLRRFQVEWLDPLGIDNGFAMVVRGKDAREKHLQTLTDASRVTAGWTLGVGYEFQQRADGLGALDATYHLSWKGRPKSMDLGLLYQALGQSQVSMIAANATDGMLSKMDLKALDDDKHAFPPYQVCILARQDLLRDTAGVRDALGALSGKFSNEKMRELNYLVDGKHRPVTQVASDFLKESGL
jgi:glycine betaine/choline ABC-type transport system substrate-binding protein